MKLFLPFTPQGKKTELAAIEVKRRLELGPYAAVEPFEVLPMVPARLIALDALPEEVRDVLVGKGVREWSAVGYGKSPSDGCELILVNTRHHENRQRASLMEELVHIVMDHPKVLLDFNGHRGEWRRPYEKPIEDEAFNVGAACIIPYQALFNALRHEGLCIEEIAARHAVSTEYVEYRIKRAGLYRVYKKACLG